MLLYLVVCIIEGHPMRWSMFLYCALCPLPWAFLIVSNPASTRWHTATFHFRTELLQFCCSSRKILLFSNSYFIDLQWWASCPIPSCLFPPSRNVWMPASPAFDCPREHISQWQEDLACIICGQSYQLVWRSKYFVGERLAVFLSLYGGCVNETDTSDLKSIWVIQIDSLYFCSISADLRSWAL